MAIRTFRPYTPGTRTRVVTDFNEVTGRKPERSLVVAKHRRKGRNNRGVITCRHRGGGHNERGHLCAQPVLCRVDSNVAVRALDGHPVANIRAE